MNKVILTGRFTRDPEIKYTNEGTSIVRFSIAVNRNYTSSDGQKETDFFNITVWRTQADNCGKYLKKGSKVAIVGSLQNRTWEDKDGVRRSVTVIIASEVEFLTSKNSQDNIEDAPAAVRPSKREKPTLDVISDDDQLPF